MKKDVVDYVSRCMTCKLVKIEHLRPGGELRSLEIPQWKWDHICMDFLMDLPKTLKKHDTIWLLVDRLTKSTHFWQFEQLIRWRIWLKFIEMRL